MKALDGGFHGGDPNPSQDETQEIEGETPQKAVGSSIANNTKEEEKKQQQGSTPMAKTGKCTPKAKEIPTMQICTEGLRAHIQHVKDHALLGKFGGIWPSVKYFLWWINVTWKP